MQIMHTGRASHAANLPTGAEVVGPAAVAMPGEIWTDASGLQPPTAPRAMTEADIGAGRVGIRLSPYGAFNATGAFDGVDAQYVELTRALGAMQPAYLHLVDHSSMGAPAVAVAFKESLRAAFGGVFIASGGFDRARAELVLADGKADLIAFGRPALANPDLVERFETGAALNGPDFATFYTPGEKGYTDYPAVVATVG